MGANISLGKPIEEVPEHGKQVTLEFLNKHWSENIATAQVEPVLAETREGVYKEDGGGASLVPTSLEFANMERWEV